MKQSIIRALLLYPKLREKVDITPTSHRIITYHRKKYKIISYSEVSNSDLCIVVQLYFNFNNTT